MIKFRSIDSINVTGKIYLHSMPGRRENIEQFIKGCDAQNIAAIICLTDKPEIESKSPLYSPFVEAGNLEGILILYSPVEDFGVPTDDDSIARYKASIEQAVNYLKTGNILIHCGAGIGRTGTFAVVLLQRLGYTFEESYQLCLSAGSRPETPEQNEFCKTF